MKIEIKPIVYPLLPNVFNLAFGPLNETGDIDDKFIVNHIYASKMFSTVLFLALLFLKSTAGNTIGIDGSDEVRAYLYHRMFLSNRESLDEYFVAIGVDWFVRLLRNGNIEVDKDDQPFFKPKPEPFDYLGPTTDLYRYYMFKLRE